MRFVRTIAVLLVLFAALVVRAGSSQPVQAIGIADVEVSNVYWGANSSSPDTAHPGDVNLQLSILITNVGDDVARNVTAILYIGPPLIYAYYANGGLYYGSSYTQVAGDINAGSSYVLTYTLSITPKAQEGVYHYYLELIYKSARELQLIDKTLTVNVPIWRGELHIQGVSTNPTKMYPDSKAVAVQVTIANSGQGTAKNVQLDLLLQPPFTQSSSGSTQIFVGNIPPGQTMPANFILDVAQNATFGQYSLTLGEVTQYSPILGQPTQNATIPIGQVPLYVAEKVKFQIVSVTPTTLHVGDSGDVVSVSFRNTASVEADSVRVELQVGNYITGTLTDFLGTVLANETKTAFFTLDIDSNFRPGQYTYNLRFDWTQDNNALNDDYSDFITFNIQPPAAPIGLIIGAIVIIGGGGGFMYMRRRKAKAAAAKPAPQTAQNNSNRKTDQK